MYVRMYVYVYIYIYIHVNVYIYIYSAYHDMVSCHNITHHMM